MPHLPHEDENDTDLPSLVPVPKLVLELLENANDMELYDLYHLWVSFLKPVFLVLYGLKLVNHFFLFYQIKKINYSPTFM